MKVLSSTIKDIFLKEFTEVLLFAHRYLSEDLDEFNQLSLDERKVSIELSLVQWYSVIRRCHTRDVIYIVLLVPKEARVPRSQEVQVGQVRTQVHCETCCWCFLILCFSFIILCFSFLIFCFSFT